MKKLFAYLILCPGENLVRVKSWLPSWGRYGMEWPTCLVDGRGGRRSLQAPVWDRAMLLSVWRKLKAKMRSVNPS